MIIPHQSISVDIYRVHPLTVDLIGHVNDKDARYLDLQLTANDEPIEFEQGCTAFVTYTTDGVLIEQDVECDIDNSKIVICFDSEIVSPSRSGIMLIQPKVIDENNVELTLQIPIAVRISPDLAQISQISDDSLGSYAEVVQEIAAARASYQTLAARLATFLTAHQDISGKVDKTTKIAGVDLQDDITAAELKTELGVVNSVSVSATDDEIPTAKAVKDCVDGLEDFIEEWAEDTQNKITEISQFSTNTQYPSALAVKNYVDAALGVIENGSY